MSVGRPDSYIENYGGNPNQLGNGRRINQRVNSILRHMLRIVTLCTQHTAITRTMTQWPPPLATKVTTPIPGATQRIQVARTARLTEFKCPNQIMLTRTVSTALEGHHISKAQSWRRMASMARPTDKQVMVKHPSQSVDPLHTSETALLLRRLPIVRRRESRSN